MQFGNFDSERMVEILRQMECKRDEILVGIGLRFGMGFLGIPISQQFEHGVFMHNDTPSLELDSWDPIVMQPTSDCISSNPDAHNPITRMGGLLLKIEKKKKNIFLLH